MSWHLYIYVTITSGVASKQFRQTKQENSNTIMVHIIHYTKSGSSYTCFSERNQVWGTLNIYQYVSIGTIRHALEYNEVKREYG